jgi:hypothetical protein
MNTITIKKKHLKWAVITIFFMIVGANCYSEYREEQKAEEVQNKRIIKATKAEYDRLYREYEYLCKQIEDEDYSISFRDRYVEELNEFLGVDRYLTTSHYIRCKDDYKDLDKKIIWQKVYKNLYGE